MTTACPEDRRGYNLFELGSKAKVMLKTKQTAPQKSVLGAEKRQEFVCGVDLIESVGESSLAEGKKYHEIKYRIFLNIHPTPSVRPSVSPFDSASLPRACPISNTSKKVGLWLLLLLLLLLLVVVVVVVVGGGGGVVVVVLFFLIITIK